MNNATLHDEIDLYSVLNIPRTASTPEIQKAYKSLSRHFHPDKRRVASEKQDAQAIFVRIKQAHDVLTDRVLRFAYDHGGMIVVEMVKRSAAKTSADSDDNDNPDNQDQENNNNDDDHSDENYYESIRRAKSRSAALKIVRQLLRAYEHHQALSHRTPLEATWTQNSCYNSFAPHPPYLASESTTMRLDCSQIPVNKQMDVSLNCTTQVQRTSTAALTTQVGLAYRPDVATAWHAFGAASTTGAKPQVTIQTSRRLLDKSMVTVGAGGSLAGSGLSTWACTLASSRVILLGSLIGRPSTAEDVKLHASWRLGLGLATGHLQSIMAQIKTTHFPQWKFRVGLGAGGDGGSLIKVSYNHAAEHSFHCTYSWHWLWYKAKITKEEALDDYWSLRYGVKYDYRGASLGQPWSIVLHLHSDEWTLRLPIDVVYRSEWPVTTVLSFLAATWLENFLEAYATSNNKMENAWTSSRVATTTTTTSPFRQVVARVGQQKRTKEAKSQGLVFLTAVWNDFGASSTREEDVTDLLQYWTVEGQLRLATSRARWSAPWTDQSTPTRQTGWWWRWWTLSSKQLLQRYKRWREPPMENSLYVRYQYHGKVYEVEIHSDQEEVVFPHPQATLMGDAGTVS